MNCNILNLTSIGLDIDLLTCWVGIKWQLCFNGSIIFNSCKIPNTLYDNIICESGYGSAKAIYCTDIDPTPSNNSVDFDFNWQNRTTGDLTNSLKSSLIKPSLLSFPCVGYAPERSVKIPKGSIIKNIYIKKPAAGSSSSEYQLFVSNGDKSEIYGSSEKKMFKDEFVIQITDLFKEVGESDVERTILLYSVGGNGVISGGYAIVEYYWYTIDLNWELTHRAYK